MKRFLLSFVTVFTIFFTVISFAATTDGSAYTATQPSKNGVKSLKSGIPYRSDFTVENNSSSMIYAYVEGGQVQSIPSGYHTDFQSNAILPPAMLVIEDNVQNVIFRKTVCRYELVSVYGSPGHYQINEDTSRC